MVQFNIILMNFLYATIGVSLAVAFMAAGYKVFDRITPFDTSTELASANTAVGIVVGSIFVGLGITVGLVMGMSLS